MCAICCRAISIDPENEDGKGYHIGEQAHIAGENPGSARHNPDLDSKIVNSYENLILLCPSCHKIIDKDEKKLLRGHAALH